MVIVLMIYLYTILKGKIMLQKEGWSLIQQTIVASYAELNTPYDLKDEQF